MSVGYCDKIANHKIGYSKFLKKRILRIYPYYLIGFLIVLVLFHPWYGKITPIVYLSNILMLQSWIPDSTFFFSLDAPSWCLSDFIFCYAMFPFLVRYMNRQRSKRLIGSLCMAICIYLLIINMISKNLQLPLIYINPLFRLMDFCLGMALWRLLTLSKGHSFSSLMHGKSIVLNTVLNM